MNVNTVIKLYGDKAYESRRKEIQQALEKKVWHPVTKSYMREHNNKVIRSFIFVKQKYTSQGKLDKLKLRIVAGGNMHDRSLYGNISSKTVSVTSVLLVAAIAAIENRNVSTIDIPGAYLHADIDDIVIVLIDKECSKILCDLEPKYLQYMHDDGKIAVQLDKAL
jgi:hypothetical protein